MTRTVVDPAEHRVPLEALLANHRAFVRYLERRVGDRALAEDILQDAFAKLVAQPDKAPADEGLVPWFYRTLRNATIDQFRRRGAAHRAAVEVSGTPVKVFAEQRGLSSNNAAVRVFGAREALKKRVTKSCGTCAEHGCVDCTCRHHQA